MSRKSSKQLASKAAGRKALLRRALDQKVAWYALAGSALLALPTAAKADTIVYSGPLDQNITGNSTLPFSVGGANFILGTGVDNAPSSVLTDGSVYLTAPAGGGVLNVIPVSPGALIGPSGQFNAGTTTLAAKYRISCGSTCTSTSKVGPRDDQPPYYVGFDFIQSGQTHYGWAEVSSDVTSGDYGPGAYASVNLYGYAYNADAGDSIPAGATIPEPPTIALLALGAIGVLALRRRRPVAL